KPRRSVARAHVPRATMSAPWLLSDSRATKGASTYPREHKGRSRPGTARVSQIATSATRAFTTASIAAGGPALPARQGRNQRAPHRLGGCRNHVRAGIPRRHPPLFLVTSRPGGRIAWRPDLVGGA